MKLKKKVKEKKEKPESIQANKLIIYNLVVRPKLIHRKQIK